MGREVIKVQEKEEKIRTKEGDGRRRRNWEPTRKISEHTAEEVTEGGGEWKLTKFCEKKDLNKLQGTH